MLGAIFALLLCAFSLFAGEARIAKVNDIEIWYESFGKKEDPALLLMMGGCCQAVIWDRAFCKRLSDEGFYVIRYDHRDAGLSTAIDFEEQPYGLMDMAKDAIGVLDVERIEKAHLFGVSMGGFLAEMLAAYFPDRVHTILLLGSSCEIQPMNRAFAGLPLEEGNLFSPPTREYLAWMKEFMKLTPITEEEKLEQRIEGWNELNGRKIPLNVERNREIQREFLSRLRHPQGIINHIIMLNSTDTEHWVRATPAKVKVPTIILQGSEDAIFPPDHGEALSQMIEGAEYLFLEGMGHIPNDHFYDLYIELLKRQAFLTGH